VIVGLKKVIVRPVCQLVQTDPVPNSGLWH
jgi:hypothetical protein